MGKLCTMGPFTLKSKHTYLGKAAHKYTIAKIGRNKIEDRILVAVN